MPRLNWNYDADFLHLGRFRQEQPTAGGIFKNLFWEGE